MPLPESGKPLFGTSADDIKAEVFSSSASIAEMEAVAKRLLL